MVRQLGIPSVGRVIESLVRAGDDEGFVIMDRHGVGRATGPGVAELLQRALDRGEPIRLAWPQPHAPVVDRDDYPTAELPVIPASDESAWGAR